MPDPMPVAVAPVKKVKVPDFSSCATGEACDALAKENELTTSYVAVGEPAFGAVWKVMGQIPAAGTEVEAGTAVQILYPPMKFVMLSDIAQPTILTAMSLPNPN